MKTVQIPRFVDYFWLVLLSAIWGSAFVAIDYAVINFPPLVVAFGRIVIASLFVLVVIFFQKISFPRDTKTWVWLVVLGILNNAMPFYLISWGQQYVSANTAAVMLAIGPFVALILSHYITHDEKFTIVKLLGVLLGFIGVFVLLGDDFLKGDANSLYGKLALLVAVLGYIASGFLIRKLSNVHALICSGAMFTTAWVVMLPFVLFIPFPEFTIVGYPFLAIVYLAIIPTAVASFIRINLVRRVGVQFMSQVSYLIPMFAIFWSWAFFNETPDFIIVIALGLILSGLFVRKM